MFLKKFNKLRKLGFKGFAISKPKNVLNVFVFTSICFLFVKIHSTALYVPKENNKSIFCTLKTDSNDHLCPDHPNSPVLWSGCGSAVPTTPLLSMAGGRGGDRRLRGYSPRNGKSLRRRMKTKEMAMVVAAVWGTEYVSISCRTRYFQPG